MKNSIGKNPHNKDLLARRSVIPTEVCLLVCLFVSLFVLLKLAVFEENGSFVLLFICLSVGSFNNPVPVQPTRG